MYLYLDANDPRASITIGRSEGGSWNLSKCDRSAGQSLLEIVAHQMAKWGVAPSAVKGIAVRVGEGSFTATRTAVVTANTLGFSLDIPVVAVSSPNEPANTLFTEHKKMYALPAYSAPPRLGPSKQSV